MKENIDATNKILNETSKNFRVDQRAWLGIKEVARPAFLENGKPVYLKNQRRSTFDVFLINSGKTPAKNVWQQISFRTLPSSLPFSPKYPTSPDRIGIVQPASTPPTAQATESQIETYRSGANILYLYGNIRYDDIFGIQHHTVFCMFLVKDLSGFADCGTYNDED